MDSDSVILYTAIKRYNKFKILTPDSFKANTTADLSPTGQVPTSTFQFPQVQ